MKFCKCMSFCGVLLVVSVVRGAGYEGHGVTSGGDKRPVARVTSLADNGPGTLREAVRQGGRHIVFAMSGTLKLKKTRAGTTGNVMHNFFGPSSNRKKNAKSVLVLMSKENAKSPAGPIHVAGNLGPGKFNLNTIGTAPRVLRAPSVTVWKPARSCRYIIQRAGARPLDRVDQALLKGLAAFPPAGHP